MNERAGACGPLVSVGHVRGAGSVAAGRTSHGCLGRGDAQVGLPCPRTREWSADLVGLRGSLGLMDLRCITLDDE
jgi:hypothetical protein